MQPQLVTVRHSLEIGVFTVFQGNRGDSHILILFYHQEIEHFEFSTSIF
jgi:hypothetical protein